jgi:hypothetical protein
MGFAPARVISPSAWPDASAEGDRGKSVFKAFLKSLSVSTCKGYSSNVTPLFMCTSQPAALSSRILAGKVVS